MSLNKKDIRRYLDNKCSPEQVGPILSFLQTPAGKTLLDQIIEEDIRSNTRNREALEMPTEIDKQKILREILASSRTRKRSHWLPVAARITAGLSLVAVLLWMLLLWNKNTAVTAPPQAETIVKENPPGLKTLFKPPDGTSVKLNSLSKLHYSSDLGSGERHVFLQGEAFFEVASDTSRPFSVYTGNITTTAIGTSFNINSFPKNEDILVSLTSGKVVVKDTRDNQSFILRPGEEVAYNKSLETMEIGEFNLFERISWKQNIIIFKNADMEEIHEVLERWYGVRITIDPNVNQTISFTGEFENQPLENVLKSMAFATQLKYKINQKNITISN